MRKLHLLINNRHQGFTRQLMFTLLMLLPIGVWATDYSLWIGGVQVTDANKDEIYKSNPDSIKVGTGGICSFNPTGNILTLKNVTADHGITSDLPLLTIRFEGTNIINGEVKGNGYYPYAQDNGIEAVTRSNTLIIEKSGAGTLELNGKDIYSAVALFSDVTLGSGCNLQSPVPTVYASYSGDGFNYFVNFYDGSRSSSVTITTDECYPLWISDYNAQGLHTGFIQATQSGSNITGGYIQADSVSYNASTNTLKLKNANIQKGKILSALGNLTIEVVGINEIISPDSGSVIRSANLGTLTLKKSGTKTSLTLQNTTTSYDFNSVIQNFGSLDYANSGLHIEQANTYATTQNPGPVNPIYSTYNTGTGYSIDALVDGSSTSTDSERAIISAVFSDKEEYAITVDGAGINSWNASNVFNDGTVSFRVSNSDYILSLNNHNGTGPIASALDNLTIEFTGRSELSQSSGYITSSDNSAILTLKGITDNQNPTGELSLKSSTNASAIQGFASITLDNAYFNTSEPIGYNTGDLKYYSVWGMQQQDLVVTTTETYPLWVYGVQLDVENTDPQNNNPIPQYYDYDPTTNTLTLEDGASSVWSGLSNLKVVVGNIYLESIQYDPFNTNDGTLEIIKDPNRTSGWALNLTDGHNPSTARIAGFKSVDFNGFVDFSSDQAYYDEQQKLLKDKNANNLKNPVIFNYLEAPTMDAMGASSTSLELTNNNIDTNNTPVGTLYYKVDYVDANKADIPYTNYDATNKPDITGAATVTAYASLNGTNSEEVTGKYFEYDGLQVESYDGNTNNVVVLNTNNYPSLVPQISANNDNVTINYDVDRAYNAVLEKDAASANILIKGLGKAKVEATLTPQASTPYAILNPGTKPDYKVSFDVKIVPAAPSILFDNTKQYLNTDSVQITSQTGTKIIYTWSTTTNYNPGDEISSVLPSGVFLSDAAQSVYVHTTSTGTLTAYTVYELANKNYLVGESANHAFSVLKDINQATLPATWTGSATYEGAAIQPTLTLQDGGNAIDASNYDVSYSDGNNTVSMTNVGTYNIVVTGKGTTYGGTKTIPFNVTQADLNNVDITAIADQTYTGNDLTPTLTVTFNQNAVDAAEYTVSYSKGGNNVTEIKEVGQYTVTLTSTNNNFARGTQKDATFNIVAATALITANDTTVTYNGAAQAYTNASVDKGSIAIAYYASEADRTADNPMAGAPTNAGTYYIKVTQTDANYTSQAKNATFTIDRAAITSMTLSAIQLVYTGGEQTVNVDEVKAGNLILAATDYSVSGNKGTAAGTYTVEVKALDTSNFQGTLTMDFTIVNRTLTMNEIDFAQGQTYASYFCNTEDLDLPAGVVAYVVTGVSGNSVTTQAVSYIPKNTAVLLEQNNNAVTTNDNITVNKLVGTTAATDISTITGGEVYVLYNGMFVNSIQGTIPANRCYLKLDQNAGARLYINHDGEDTGIDNILIDETEQWYDLRGRKLQGRPTKKGLYLRNGVKVVVK